MSERVRFSLIEKGKELQFMFLVEKKIEGWSTNPSEVEMSQYILRGFYSIKRKQGYVMGDGSVLEIFPHKTYQLGIDEARVYWKKLKAYGFKT